MFRRLRHLCVYGGFAASCSHLADGVHNGEKEGEEEDFGRFFRTFCAVFRAFSFGRAVPDKGVGPLSPRSEVRVLALPFSLFLSFPPSCIRFGSFLEALELSCKGTFCQSVYCSQQRLPKRSKTASKHYCDAHFKQIRVQKRRTRSAYFSMRGVLDRFFVSALAFFVEFEALISIFPAALIQNIV